MTRIPLLLVVLALLAPAASPVAVAAPVTLAPCAGAPNPTTDDEVYCVLDLTDLTHVDDPDAILFELTTRVRDLPHVVLEGGGEAFVALERRDRGPEDDDGSTIPWPAWRNPFIGVPSLAVRVPEGHGASGTLQFPGAADEVGTLVRFELPAEAFTSGEADFLRVEQAHYERLLAADLPGAAWFRHRRDDAAARVDPSDPSDEPDAAAQAERARAIALTGEAALAWRRRNRSTVEDSFALFSGGRAVSENLALDRMLPPSIEGEDTVPIEGLAGISTRAYDWSALVAGLDPERDPLAAVIPEDQHALFFRDFEALIAVADHAEHHGAPVLAALEPRTESAGTRDRYERQLGLPMSALSRMLGPAVVRSVAVTGADPYLRTGADVALLFEGDADVLEPLLITRVGLAALDTDDAEAVRGSRDDATGAGTSYAGFVTPDRSLCSYIARVGPDAVVVTNSLAQLDRLLATAQGETTALASLDEYRFFRDRYRRGDAEESALLVLTDATIRRWCGPRWRIGASRRSRAEALLADDQARAAEAIVSGGAGARSEAFGDLAFATPILELDLDRVTEAEQDLYLRWRQGYESNWAEVFDPIAVRCTVDAEELALDVTVRPLIVGSDYEDLVEMSAGAELLPHAGDPHDGTLLHWVAAFDKQAGSLSRNMVLGLARTIMPHADPLGWMGSSFAVYADQDPFWDELAAYEPPDDWEEDTFWYREGYRLPLALHADVEDPLQLALFLTGLRAYVEQSAPDLLSWENRQHAGRSYVRIAPTDLALEDFWIEPDREAWNPPALHYVATGHGLVLSLSESLIQRVIERQVERSGQRATERAADGAVGPPEPPPFEWLGRNVALRVDRGVLTLVEDGLVGHGIQPLQALAWSNLPILDEWKRRWPDRDPLAIHEQLWGRRLLCPGGGDYRWNADDRRMESTLYGHPGRPRSGPVLPEAAQDIGSAAFGLDFEEDGLRARVRLTRRD